MTASVLLPLLLLAVLLAVGMPVAFALAGAALVGIVWNSGPDAALALFETMPYRHSASFELTTIPLFILMAEFLSRGRLVREIFAAASAWLGGVRGGLAVATVGANTLFAALSGSSTAAVGSMARVTVPEMRRYGYSDKLSMGTVAASGTLAVMIPPSGALIIYGALTETSVSQLFIAGIIPGALTALGFMVLIVIWARINPALAPLVEVTGNVWKARLTSGLKVWPGILLMVGLLGAIYTGAVTPTEAAAVGAVGGLLISVFFGGMRWAGFIEAIKHTVQATGMILLLIVGATLFGSFLTLTRITPSILEWVTSLGVAPLVVILVLVLVYVVLGMFLDVIAIMVLTLPLTFPLVMDLGYSPIWFGILVVKLAEIGLITPPFGLNAFVANGAVSGDIRDTFVGASRFLIVEAVLVALLLFMPSIATVLTDAMG